MEEEIDVIEETSEEREERLNKVLQKSDERVPDESDLTLDYYHSRLYIRNMRWYMKCRSGVSYQLLMYMIDHMDARTGRVLLPASRRQELVRKCGMSNQSVTNALKELRNVNVVLPYKENIPGPNGEKTGEVFCPSGVYWMNPKMVWLGSESARRHAYLAVHEFYPNI